VYLVILTHYDRQESVLKKIKVKVKFALKHAMKAKRGNKSRALFSLTS
jgi:hypothetical protein